jgi:hypothetical protein
MNYLLKKDFPFISHEKKKIDLEIEKNKEIRKFKKYHAANFDYLALLTKLQQYIVVSDSGLNFYFFLLEPIMSPQDFY